jgi:hypothetical protein
MKGMKNPDETNIRHLSKIVTKLQVTEGNNPQVYWGKLKQFFTADNNVFF